MLTNADLMRIFDFTEDDLEANRAGRISERQVSRLKIQSNDTMGCGVAAILSFTCLGLFAGLAELSGNPVPRMGSKDTPGLTLLIFGIGIAIAVVTMLLRRADAQTEIREGVVAAIEGAIKPIKERSGRNTWYSLRVNSSQLTISNYVYDELTTQHGDSLEQLTCRVYYALHTKKVLSVEILDAPES